MKPFETFGVLFKKEWLWLLRSYKLLVLAGIFLLFGIASPFTARYIRDLVAFAGADLGALIPEPTYRDAIAQFVKNTSQIISFVLIFLFMGSVAGEKKSGTALFVLVKPVSRGLFLLAKLVTAWLAVLFGSVVSGFLCYLYTVWLFGSLNFLPFLAVTGCLSLNLLFLTTLVIISSTLFPSGGTAALVAFIAWILLLLLAQLPRIGQFSPAALINLSQQVFNREAWSWQPFAGTLCLGAGLVLAGMVQFRKWEP